MEQTFQPLSHANLEVLKTSPEKPGDWDLKPGDFQKLSHFVILLHSRVLDNEQPSWFVFEAKLPQKPLRTNVSLEWGWHLHCTQFSLTNRLITLIRLLRTQIVCYSFIFSSLCRIFLGNFEVFGSPWDLKAKPWDREMASQTVSVTVKPWELEGLKGESVVRQELSGLDKQMSELESELEV